MTNCTSAPTRHTSWLNTSQKSTVVRQIHESDIPVYIIYGIIALIGCICNSITVAVMKFNPSLHTLYNFLLLNLAVADLIASLMSIAKFIVIFCVRETGVSGFSAALLCRFFTTIVYTSIALSINTLTAIAFERYLGIVKPLVHRSMTKKRLNYFLFFSWFVTIFGTAIFSGELQMDKKTYFCFFSAEEEDWPRWKLVCSWMLLTFVFIIPFITITILYTRIILHMRKRNRGLNLAISENSQGAELATKKTAKMVRLLIAITVLFALSNLPELVYFAMIFSDRKYVDASLFYKIGIPTVAIIAINPFVYTLSNSTFRVAAQRLFLRPRRRQQVAPTMLATRTTGNTT